MKRNEWTLEELSKLPRTEEEAIKSGSKYYYSRIPCERGHVAAREIRRNRCVECRRKDGTQSADKRRRRLGIKKQEALTPLQPDIRINKLKSTGGFKRGSFAGKNQNYTRVYHEVKCDCGEVFWIRSNAWGEQIQCKKCDSQEKLKLAHKAQQKKAFIPGGVSQTIEATLLYSARRRAFHSGIDFKLALADIKIPKYCPVLCFRLDGSLRSSKSHNPRFNAPSLDRLNSNLGYTKDNVKVISYRANVLKKDGTASEHLKVAEFMERMGVIK